MAKTNHPLFNTYWCMKHRCYYPSNPRYHRYGARGITVCQRWLDSFWDFVADMGSRPDGYQLDRINNDGNYEPSNCRWVDRITQANNRPTASKRRIYSTYAEKARKMRRLANPELANKKPHGNTGKCYRSNLSKEQVLEIYHSTGRAVEVCTKYGVHHGTITNIRNGLTWANVTGHNNPTT